MDPIQRLIQEFGKLPGIGQKTATRLAFHILRLSPPQVHELSDALLAAKERIRLCSVCLNVTEQDPCTLCQDPRRDNDTLCVVSYPTDLLVIERTGVFKGKYHVLHGLLSPLEGVGPEQLRIRELLQRLTSWTVSSETSERTVQSGVPATGVPRPEVILATSPNIEGEATATYLVRLLKPLGVRVTRLASGLPMGGELEYADGPTIRRALEVRREM